MKYALYIALFAFTLGACSTPRNLSMEDDIYYVPGEKALVVKEVEQATGQEINTATLEEATAEKYSRAAGSDTPPLSFQKKNQVINTRTGQLEQVDPEALASKAQNLLANNEEVNELLYENTGYWIGGFKGNENDLEEIQRIINLYPQGFASFNGNGADIAINLSFDPDWNVYTDNGRYWWFPSSSNVNLYSSLLFGTYPKYIWTVIWDSPTYDSWAFNSNFNWNFGLNLGWGSPGWSLGLGWNSGWYNPWYNGWYNPWYGGWYDPWVHPWYGYYPGWRPPHWYPRPPHWDHPNWGGGNRPVRPGTPVRPGSSRPGLGNHISGVRPGTSVRPGTGSTRPSTGVRPGTGSSIRPGTSTRPNTNTRPSTNIRPGTSTRPSTVTRPSTNTRPATNTRPGTMTRPGN